MLKISDDNDNKYAYIYSKRRREVAKAKKLFEGQVVDIGAPILYKGCPAILIRKSN